MIHIPAPEEHLGYLVGTDRKLADWPEIVEYYMKVAEASPRVTVKDLGKTTEGNPFLLAIITSEENMANLDELRKIQLRLSNPEGLSDEEANELIEKGKTVVLITCSIHSTEVGGSQMSMELLHELASEDTVEVKEVLDNVVFLLVPSLNPDGNRLVVDWYQRYLGTKYEGSNPPYVYHKYAGHDNNRDWYMFTLKETQMTIEHAHNQWHPQIVYDIHQMGRTGPRFYVPPFIDPMEPNIDPVLQSGVNFMGISMADALAREGKKGVAVHWVFDGWTPARAYQHYHGGIRILSEAASVKIASPIEIKKEELESGRGFNAHEARWNHPIPWEGGQWTLRDIIEYEKTAAFACLQTAAKFRKRWLNGTLTIGRNALNPRNGPYAFLIHPAQRDPGALNELLWVLRMGDVNIQRAKDSFTADDVDYPAGTYVIPYAQPYGGFAKTLLERQVYPDLRDNPDMPPKVPYDVTAHTLSMQLGVEVVHAEEPFDAELEQVEDLSMPEGEVHGRRKPYYAFSPVPNYSAKAVNRLLDEGYTVSRSLDELELENQRLKPGAFIVESKPGIHELLESMAKELGLEFYSLKEELSEVFELSKPRVGVYRAWLPNADEGWLRMVLDEYGFEYVNLYPEDVRKGELSSKIDVLVIPDLNRDVVMDGMVGQRYYDPKQYEAKYRKGIGEKGNAEVLKFLEAGGTVIALNRSCEYAVKELWAGAELPLEGLSDKEFYCPGSLLRVLVDNTHPVGYGFRREEAIMFLKGPALRVREGQAVAWYPEADPLLSGWVLGEKHLRGNAAVAEVPAGDGTIILIGCPPHFRNQNRATFKLLFNSIYYGVA
ncbi:MAG: M14 family metallopeptidase [Candidatus Bathyarchaeota archaeon]|nr:M14 family metallopeptidase [Candidatus Bathyarchaeota archaeon]